MQHDLCTCTKADCKEMEQRIRVYAEIISSQMAIFANQTNICPQMLGYVTIRALVLVESKYGDVGLSSMLNEAVLKEHLNSMVPEWKN